MPFEKMTRNTVGNFTKVIPTLIEITIKKLFISIEALNQGWPSGLTLKDKKNTVVSWIEH